MENIRERIVSCADRVWFCAKELLKWLALAMIIGVPCGIIGAAFDLAVEHVTELRTEHTAILFLLPVIGLVIVAFYKAAKLEGVSTDDMIDCVKDGKPIRFWLLPVMFISTVLTHLGGGSAGREGAALQMGGTIGWWAGGVLHLNEHERRMAVQCGMAAFFSALFSTPLAATFFAMTIVNVGVVFYAAYIPCFTAAIIAYGVAQLIGVTPTRFVVEAPAFEPAMVVRVVLLALAGAAPAVPACLLLLAGWMGAWAASCSVQRRALWGRRDTENYRQNLCRHYNIQKSAALAVGGLCLALALPCWWLLRPALGVPLGWLQPAAQRVESAALSTAITWLPRVSGGRLNIQVEAAAGGVVDGALSQGGGIQVSGVTDLALTASDKPEETVYLRGFIGGSYDGTTWQAPDADAFDSAAMNWKTEDNARLTIASLPFLRTAYDGTAQPQTLTVERIHADTQYTYAPYNAYWGDYYTIQGDGAAAGQTAQDDVFLYYPRDTAQTQLEARADADPSVLDRMEASYAAYAASRYTAVPDGYDELQTLCDEAKKDQKLTEAADIGDYIRAYLNTNYQYNASAPQPPEGADPIRYFLTESKQGYSVQFASAAVVMFRMFGLPARYVVGYAAPQSLFTQQENGSWHAILQDDNAHAWAEVYISGQGWTPMEMTPGVLVSAQQADLRTDPLPETQGQDTAPAAGESSANEPATTIVPRSRLVLAALLGGCLLAAAVLLVLARRHAMGYGRGSCNARVLAVFGSIYRLLVRRGLPPDTPSDAPEFAAFLQSCVPTLEPQDAEALLALAQAAQFGAGTMTEQDTDKMRKLYQVIKHTGKRKQSQKSVEKQSQE